MSAWVAGAGAAGDGAAGDSVVVATEAAAVVEGMVKRRE